MSAASWFASKGALVAWPLGHSRHWDLVVECDDVLYRVQVKTCCHRTPKGRWSVMLCTRGGNQSWSGTTKLFDPRRCDYLFIHTGDGQRWCIPSTVVEGRTAIALGGPKYAEYEVERGEPLPARTTVVIAA